MPGTWAGFEDTRVDMIQAVWRDAQYLQTIANVIRIGRANCCLRLGSQRSRL